MLVIQILLGIFAIFVMIKVIQGLRNKTMGIIESVFWTGLWIIMLIIAIFPRIIDFSRFVGIQNAINFLTYTSILVLFYLVFRLYGALDKQEQKFNTLLKELTIERALREGKSTRQTDKKNSKRGDLRK